MSDIRQDNFSKVRLNIRQYWITGLIISISGIRPNPRLNCYSNLFHNFIEEIYNFYHVTFNLVENFEKNLALLVTFCIPIPYSSKFFKSCNAVIPTSHMINYLPIYLVVCTTTRRGDSAHRRRRSFSPPRNRQTRKSNRIQDQLK